MTSTDAIDKSDAVVAFVVDAGFSNLLRKGQSAPVQAIVDGTNSNTALIALGYINTIAARSRRITRSTWRSESVGCKG